MNKRIETIPADAMAALSRYAWPGNVRELENAIVASGCMTGAILAEIGWAPTVVITVDRGGN